MSPQLSEKFDRSFALHKQGQLEKARQGYLSILEEDANNFDATHFLGVLRHQSGENEQAIALLKKAVALRPQSVNAHYNLAVVQQAAAQKSEAISTYRKVLQLDPQHALAHNNLGTLLRDRGDWDEALLCYQKALQIDPDCVEAWNNISPVYRKQNQPAKALQAAEEAIARAPRLAEAYVNKGYALGRLNHIEAALACFRQALSINPHMPEEHSVIVMNNHYLDSKTPQEIFTEHLRWAQEYADPLLPTGKTHRNKCDPEKRLRIGYVSQDFCYHSVAFFLEPLLTHRDPQAFEIYCYSNTRKQDYITDRLQKNCDVWRDISKTNPSKVARMIEHDEIDILVDLSGHTPGNALLAFAEKPAPLQITYLGYPDTTGMQAMDYRITDQWADPVGVTDALHTETLVRLNSGFLCYRPNDFAPEVNALPALRKGYVTFGSFNSFSKLSRHCVQVWAELLKRVPSSRLCLKYKNLTEDSVVQGFVALFNEYGVTREQLQFVEHMDRPEDHLAAYHDIDIALDPFPYNGTTTTCEAMWMGVPVVTLAGQAHVSRVGVSLLTNAGMPQLIANSEEEYIALAATLAGNLDELANIRRHLRPQMAASNLTNAPLLVRSMEQAYRALWQHYCA